MRIRAARGSTLIELMITVVIIAVVLSAGLPALSKWLANVRVRNAADGMQNALRLSQAQAVRTNATVTLRLTADTVPSITSTASPTGMSWIILDAAGAKVQGKGSEGQVGVTMTPLKADGTSASDFTGDIIYSGLGRTTNQTAALQFEFRPPAAGDHPMRVWLTPAGRVRLCDPARSTGDTQACE